MSFWDSSVLVPLCVNEYLSQISRQYWRRFTEHVVWEGSPVEISSAIARRLREGAIDNNALRKAETCLLDLEKKWKEIEHNSRLIEIARTFPQVYGLRSLDSLQLASALVWCNEFPNGKDFVSADNRLLKAAATAGFSIHDLT